MKTCIHPGCDQPRMEGKSQTVNRCPEHQREYWRSKKASKRIEQGKPTRATRSLKPKRERAPKKSVRKRALAPIKTVLVDWAAGTLVKGSIVVESEWQLHSLKLPVNPAKFAILLDVYRALGYCILERGAERLPEALEVYQEHS